MKVIIGLAVACAGTCLLAACGTPSKYPEYADEGYAASVYYDANGGLFGSKADTHVVYVYPNEEVKKGVKLLSPSDMRDKYEPTQQLSLTRDGYFLAGWYRERTERTNEAGEPLDEDGELTSVSGKPQGYIYDGYWDFDTDVFQLDHVEYKEGEYTMRLYAAWIPNYTYEFYEKTGGEWQKYGTYTFNPLFQQTIPLPSWNTTTGAMDYGQFPSLTGNTFVNAYTDAEMSEPVEALEAVEWDREHGVAIDRVHSVYVEFKKGVWFQIDTAQQFANNLRSDGCYEIRANLDFEKVVWPVAFSRGTFGGTIRGNGHTFSNISVKQDNTSDTFGGLFGRITADAVFENVRFENLTYTLGAGSRLQGARFGLFAGELSQDATMTDVTVSGTLVIGGNRYPQMTGDRKAYDVGLLTGNYVTGGISMAEIKLRAEEGCEASADASGVVTITEVPKQS